MSSNWGFSNAAVSEARFREVLAEVESRASQLEVRTQVARAQGLQRKFDVALDRLDVALAIQRELYAEHEASKSQDAYVYEELGELLLASGKYEEARPYFERAYGLLAEDGWFVVNEAERLERLRKLSVGELPEP